MYKKTITYLDYNGEEIKEDFYFNLTKAEILEMQLEKEGGLAEKDSDYCRLEECS